MTEHSSSQLKNTTTPTNDSTHVQDTTYQNPVSSISNFMVGGSSIADANPETILQLQSIVGNRAVLGMIQRDGNGGNSAKEDESAPEVSAPPDPLRDSTIIKHPNRVLKRVKYQRTIFRVVEVV